MKKGTFRWKDAFLYWCPVRREHIPVGRFVVVFLFVFLLFLFTFFVFLFFSFSSRFSVSLSSLFSALVCNLAKRSLPFATGSVCAASAFLQPIP
ncbi:MAG: hypothetical protein ACLR1G_15835 [Alistipes indistinctus]